MAHVNCVFLPFLMTEPSCVSSFARVYLSQKRYNRPYLWARTELTVLDHQALQKAIFLLSFSLWRAHWPSSLFAALERANRSTQTLRICRSRGCWTRTLHLP